MRKLQWGTSLEGMVVEIIVLSDQQDHALPGFCGGLHCPKQTTLPPDDLHPISAIIWRNSQKIFEVTIECAITSCQTIPWMFIAVMKHFVLCWHGPTSWCINFRSHLRSPKMAIKSWFINEYVFSSCFGGVSRKIHAYTLHISIVLTFDNQLVVMHTLMWSVIFSVHS